MKKNFFLTVFSLFFIFLNLYGQGEKFKIIILRGSGFIENANTKIILKRSFKYNIQELDNITLYPTSSAIVYNEKVNLELATIFTNKFNSYNKVKETPQTPDLYNGNQILLNSGRLVFNAKNDHILLSADKSIHLSSNGSINIDTTTISAYSNEIRLTAPKVYLGNFVGGEGYVGAPLQSVVLGDNLKQTLTSIIEALGGIANAMATSFNAGGPIPSLQAEGGLLLGQVETLKTSLNILLSENVKTI
jgi:hypothetical protein